MGNMYGARIKWQGSTGCGWRTSRCCARGVLADPLVRQHLGDCGVVHQQVLHLDFRRFPRAESRNTSTLSNHNFEGYRSIPSTDAQEAPR